MGGSCDWRRPPLAADACSDFSTITKSALRRDFHDREDFYIEKRKSSRSWKESVLAAANFAGGSWYIRIARSVSSASQG
jgi:hypothetical protein